MATKSVSPAPSVFATFIRGGTSKAVFFHEKDIPPPGAARDRFLVRIMGSPDLAQIDGMGGGRVVTSKVAIIRPSKRPDADIDYIFAQIGLGEATVSYDANCGNISSGVGPFAINEGLVKSSTWCDGKRVVKIYNTGTDAPLVAHVPVDPATGRALEKGNYAISGCQGTGAPILMDYSQTALPKRMLPTGNAIDRLDSPETLIEDEFIIQHPAGHLPISVKTDDCEDYSGTPTFHRLGFMRTARYIFQGNLFIPSGLE
ncbi:putative isomerase YraM [Colletotrichum siamense]|nr:putative isomerase YraM [Colletotrichum siamense]